MCFEYITSSLRTVILIIEKYVTLTHQRRVQYEMMDIGGKLTFVTLKIHARSSTAKHEWKEMITPAISASTILQIIKEHAIQTP